MNHIIRLSISNLLRITCAEITPDGAVVMVAGRNDQGKSSVLNSIAIALWGKDHPAFILHQGAPKGSVEIELEDMIIRREFSASGGGKLTVSDKEGKPFTSPQEKLNKLVQKVTFDPLEFTRMKDADQLETLKRIVGLDFEAMDKDRAELYLERTGVGRRRDEAAANLRGLKRNPQAPAEPIILSQLLQEIENAKALNAANESARQNVFDLKDAKATAQNELGVIDAALSKLQTQRQEKLDEIQRIEGEQLAASKDIETLPDDVDIDELTSKLANAESLNAQVAENVRYDAAQKDHITFVKAYDSLTSQIDGIDAEKEKKVKASKFPIDGLAFSDAGVTFNGMPFKQAASSGQIRASLAIAKSLNPALPVMLIKDGSLLDEDSLKLLTEFAEEHECQVWLECVGNREDATVIIEDGIVVDTPAAKKKGKK